MTWLMGKECCVCGGYMEPIEVRKNPGKDITLGICPICGPKWHAEQMAEVEAMIKHEKEVQHV